MLKAHRTTTTNFRTWGQDSVESYSSPTSPTNLTPEESLQSITSWTNISQEPTTMTASACVGELQHAPLAGLQRDISGVELFRNDRTQATETSPLDANTIWPHPIGALSVKPKTTWHTQASIPGNPYKLASMFRGVVKQGVNQLDIPQVLHRLEQTACECKEAAQGWISQKFANYDKGETHGCLKSLIPTIPNPDIRQSGYATDTVAEIARSLRHQHLDLELLQTHPDDKYIFAHVVSRKAECALIEQGICKEWQLIGRKQREIRRAIRFSLLYTFTRTRQLYTGVPFHQAKPQWLADQEKHAWRLDLDVGRVGVEVGPISDRSLIELGVISTGFELPMCPGCASILDSDHRYQAVQHG
ncbi:hypothetical protein OPT61_g4836 [Boeremia exigua]|uniref:Uncharacterized protein n=1 Tax=Boeremia exigua TaxID=749465 RepID=A0ACC2ICH8_9PLEO|nr:hypothetical protein OPT61_g4836 [Boeremia exigua]